MARSEGVEDRCLSEVEKLEKLYDRITSCRVIVAQPHRNQRTGNLYDVRIDLAVPGGEIVVDREPPAQHQNEDLTSALRDAFDRARRRLEDFVEKRRNRDRVRSEPA
jgi:ribosome-associated translation inhibitor RaiA